MPSPQHGPDLLSGDERLTRLPHTQRAWNTYDKRLQDRLGEEGLRTYSSLLARLDEPPSPGAQGGTPTLPGPDPQPLPAGHAGRLPCTAGARMTAASAAGPSAAQRVPTGHLAAAKPVPAAEPGPQSAEGAADSGRPETPEGAAEVVPWDAGHAPAGGKRKSSMLGALLAEAAAKRARKNRPAAADQLSPAIRVVVSHGVRGRPCEWLPRADAPAPLTESEFNSLSTYALQKLFAAEVRPTLTQLPPRTAVACEYVGACPGRALRRTRF